MQTDRKYFFGTHIHVLEALKNAKIKILALIHKSLILEHLLRHVIVWIIISRATDPIVALWTLWSGSSLYSQSARMKLAKFFNKIVPTANSINFDQAVSGDT